MANLRTNNLSGEQGQNAIRGSVFFKGNVSSSGDIPTDYLSVADHDDLDMGTGDFTFECWLLATKYTGLNDPSFMGFCSSQDWTAGGMLIQVANTGVLRIAVPLSGGGYLSELGSTNIYNVKGHDWVHIAVVKTSGTIKGYVNGVEEISASYNVGVDFAHGGTCTIGENGINQYLGDYAFRGYISNLRITKGLARYTSTFTPPAFELTADADTVLLCCQDSDNPTREETGKTITGFGNLQEFDDTELVTNSGFTNDISGWTISGIQWTHSNGALMHFGNGSTQRNAYQDVTTVIGKKYVARVLASSAEANTAYWQVGPTDGTVTINYVADNNNSAQLPYHYYFIATSTTTRIRFYSYDSSNSSNVRSYWYLASIKLAEQPKAPKVIPPYGVDAGNTFGGSIQQSSEGYMYFPTGRTVERGRGRGLFHGGYVGPSPGNSYNAQLAAVDIQSTGTFQIFGDLTQARYTTTTVGSSTRSIFAGGGVASPAPFSSVTTLDFVEIATTGNATLFGNLTNTGYQKSAVSSSTRGIVTGGRPYTPNAGSVVNTLDLVIIASLGEVSDFGDINGPAGEGGRFTMPNTAMSPTRGLFAGGKHNSPSDYVNTIELITMATTGNTTDFGDLIVKGGRSSGNCSSNTRGVFSLSNYPSSDNITIEFVTIASTGNAKDFGDHATATTTKGALSDTIRGLFYGGFNSSISGTYQNNVDQITIATTGNAVDWGDIQLSTGTGRGAYASGISDSHGGLS